MRNLALPFHKSDVGCNLYKEKIIKHFFETKSTHVSVRFTITKICGISFEWSGEKSQGLFLKGQDFKEQTLWDKTERKLVKPLYLLGKITFKNLKTGWFPVYDLNNRQRSHLTIYGKGNFSQQVERFY